MRTLFVLTTVVCVWSGWQSATIRERESRRYADLADAILIGRHWEVWKSRPETQAYAMYESSGITTAIRSYPTRFLVSGGSFSDGGSPNQFEQSIFSRFEVPAGTDYIREGCYHRSDKVAYYYHPIRTRQNCLKCHGEPLQEGDLIAVMKIQLPEHPPNARAQSWASMPNRLERSAKAQHLVN